MAKNTWRGEAGAIIERRLVADLPVWSPTASREVECSKCDTSGESNFIILYCSEVYSEGSWPFCEGEGGRYALDYEHLHIVCKVCGYTRFAACADFRYLDQKERRDFSEDEL